MNKKGFTLVEMLGVITVLAILALIVVPMVMNQLRSKKTEIRKSIVESINAAAVKYIDRNKANFNGQINSCVKISTLVENDLLDDTLYGYSELGVDLSEAYILTKSYDKDAEVSLTCSPVYVTYNTGASIYFNPETANICSNPSSSSGLKSGCMKWYIFNDSKTSDSVSVILDHNTSLFVSSSSSLSQLNNDTATWNSGVKSTARLITANEIAKITGADEALSWNSSKPYTSSAPTIGTNISRFYFDGSFGSDATWRTQIAKAAGASKFAWLYDYTKCSDSNSSTGCNYMDSKTDYTYSSYTNLYVQGYWTSTAVTGETGKTWKVDMYGCLITENDSVDYKNGIRPVISISKSLLK